MTHKTTNELIRTMKVLLGKYSGSFFVAYRGLVSNLMISLLVFSSGCISHTTLISSDPSAEVSIGELKGKEPGSLEHHDRTPFWGTKRIKIVKSGCQPKYYEISKTDELSPEGFFLGFITYGLGWFWIGTYLPQYNLNYQCSPILGMSAQ